MTYGTNAPLGLVPVAHADGSPWNGATNEYAITSAYATSIFLGDPVTTLADGSIGIGVAGSAIRGIFMGCMYQLASQPLITNSFYWPASTAVKTGTVPVAYIMDDPSVLLDVQETNGSSAAGTPLALADRGLNINFVVGSGNTATGLSTSSLNNTTENTTAALNLKLIRLTPRPGNVVGSFANWLCTINNHQFKGGTGTVGT